MEGLQPIVEGTPLLVQPEQNFGSVFLVVVEDMFTDTRRLRLSPVAKCVASACMLLSSPSCIFGVISPCHFLVDALAGTHWLQLAQV